LRARLASEPEAFSGNALLRPVLQDYLLPTAAYIGGPAEIAYLAQSGVLYERLLGRQTPALTRFSATLVEPRISSLMEKYELSLPQLFHGPEETRELLASRRLPTGLDRSFEDAKVVLED